LNQENERLMRTKTEDGFLSTGIIVSAGGRQEKRVYYRRVPDALAPLKAPIERLIELAKSEGQKELYQQAKLILPAGFEVNYRMAMGTAPPQDYSRIILMIPP
jgi:hypothetical protein